jgi:peptidoglycan/xylan/chitin deacetylase (PgdA/CDA1 family)/GT2 family glycosyltransferase
MPELSVVVPTYQRRALVLACVASLVEQSLDPRAYEIIVVVDGSDDGTGEALRALATPCSLRVEEIANGGAARARNRGAEVASGTYCLFLDDDMVADPTLLAAHLETQRAHGGVLGIGALHTDASRSSHPITSRMVTWLNDHNQRLTEGHRAVDAVDCLSGNVCVPLAPFRAVGGFATDIAAAEDTELGIRLAEAGVAATFVASARSAQRFDKDWRTVLRETEHRAGATVELFRRHPAWLPRLPLGSFGSQPLRMQLALRALLAARVSSTTLVRAARVLPPRLRRSARWWALVDMHAYWSGVRAAAPDHELWAQLTRPPVILMYHAIGSRGESATMYRVPARRFRWQLRYLRWRRRPVLTLDELVQHRDAHRLPPAGAVVLTFDDGYLDNLEVALPLLRRFDVRATVFVVTSLMDQQNGWDSSGELTTRRLLSWDDARALRDAGIEIASHTDHHPHLTHLTPDEVDAELRTSAEQIAAALGEAPRTFAYPYGDYDEAVRDRVAGNGYAAACTVRPGLATPSADPYQLPRIAVAGVEGLGRFALGIELGGIPRRLRSKRRPGRRAA